jgi:hypothetical protein
VNNAERIFRRKERRSSENEILRIINWLNFLNFNRNKKIWKF